MGPDKNVLPMKEKKHPITITKILLNITGCEGRANATASHTTPEPVVGDSRSREVQFDCRRDFLLPRGEQFFVNAFMTFVNPGCLEDSHTESETHKITVELFDVTDERFLPGRRFDVEFPENQYTVTCCVEIPVETAAVNVGHNYSLVVSDDKSEGIIGSRDLIFFSETVNGTHISEWFKAFSGGVSPSFALGEFLAFRTRPGRVDEVRFYLRCQTSKTPVIVPEMEIRIHYPNCAVDSNFFHPEEYVDDVEGDAYRVTSPMMSSYSRRGIGYAELICLDFPIAGFVFCSDGDAICRPCENEELIPLDEYSPAEAARRFLRLVQSPDEAGVSMTDTDPFEELLNDFVSIDNPGEAGPQVAPMTPSVENSSSGPSSMDALAHLVGLRNVKGKLESYEKLMMFERKRRIHGLPSMDQPLHAMFMGSPGTGKTTVAQMMGQMLHRAGMLSRGHVVVRERSTLLGPNYSMEESNTLSAIEEAQGGILFIDEAYQLYQPNDARDPGKFVIETLLTALADESRRDWMLILAGYTDEMKRMFDLNPGLKSRIPESNIYLFDDFDQSELMEIAENCLASYRFELSPEARQALQARVEADYLRKERGFGNARYVKNLIQTEIVPRVAQRVMAGPDTDDDRALTLIHAVDIPAALPKGLQESRRRVGFSS